MWLSCFSSRRALQPTLFFYFLLQDELQVSFWPEDFFTWFICLEKGRDIENWGKDIKSKIKISFIRVFETPLVIDLTSLYLQPDSDRRHRMALHWTLGMHAQIVQLCVRVGLLTVGAGVSALGTFFSYWVPYPTLLWGFVASLIASFYAVFRWYLWEGCSSLKQNGSLVERSGARENWEEGREEMLQSGWIVWE